MAFEKEKKINAVMMVIGIILMAAGIGLYLISHKIAGVTMLILGLSLLLISWTISNVFYRMKMKELLEGRKKIN